MYTSVVPMVGTVEWDGLEGCDWWNFQGPRIPRCDLSRVFFLSSSFHRQVSKVVLDEYNKEYLSILGMEDLLWVTYWLSPYLIPEWH